MDAVHPRRHDNGVQEMLGVGRQLEVAVMKDDREHEQLLPEAQRAVIDAKQGHLQRPEPGSHRELAKMKSDTGRRIEIEIDVMNGVEAPEERRAMVDPVPEIERVVEQQEAEEH